MPYGGWMKLAVCKARRYYKRRYARLSIARCGCVNLTADRMKRSFTLTCIAGKRFAIFCAIYIAASFTRRFSFCGGSLTGAVNGDSLPALDRGASSGALMRLEHPNASAEAALTMLAQLSPAQSGEALHGLLALARHQLACQPAFIAGFSSHLNQLSEAD